MDVAVCPQKHTWGAPATVLPSPFLTHATKGPLFTPGDGTWGVGLLMTDRNSEVRTSGSRNLLDSEVKASTAIPPAAHHTIVVELGMRRAEVKIIGSLNNTAPSPAQCCVFGCRM